MATPDTPPDTSVTMEMESSKVSDVTQGFAK